MCALVVPSGGLISQVNGTVDNKVYYRGRWGNVVRAWVNPANTITAKRTAIRALFASLMSLFNSLTPDMQDDWDKFAQYQKRFNRLAQPYIPTGLQVFLERNMNLGIMSQGPLLIPPDDTNLMPVISGSIGTLTPLVFNINATFFDNTNITPAGFGIVYYATDNQPPGRSFMSNRYRLVNYRFNPNNITNFDISIEWTNAWTGPRITGQKIFLKLLTINTLTGQASQPWFGSKIVS